ncbi:hypothetical protein PMAYCL1PPCAC_31437, partial [Pristionchus mayeri]
SHILQFHFASISRLTQTDMDDVAPWTNRKNGQALVAQKHHLETMEEVSEPTSSTERIINRPSEPDANTLSISVIIDEDCGTSTSTSTMTSHSAYRTAPMESNSKRKTMREGEDGTTRTSRSDRDLMLLRSLRRLRKRVRETREIVLQQTIEEEGEGAVGAAHRSMQWIDCREAREGFLHYLTFLYALLVTIFLVVEETTQRSANGDSPVGIVFHCIVYIVALLFIVYVNLFVIDPSCFNRLLVILAERGWWKTAESHKIMPAARSSESVSTLFLRMGTLMFGCGGLVLFALELYLLFSGRVSRPFLPLLVGENILGAAFVFTQMQFMNVNRKLLIRTSRNVCRFGFMHCIAVNIWMWFRHAEAKANKTLKKQMATERISSVVEDILASQNTTLSSSEQQWSTVASVEFYGNFVGVLNTCLIEFTVIGLTVMLVFWLRLDPFVSRRFHESKRKFRIDFRNSRSGFYLGIAMFVVGTIACGVYEAKHAFRDRKAYLILGGFECLCYCCCIAAVVTGTLFMRSLSLRGGGHGDILDLYLLLESFCGEVIWCSAELARFLNDGGAIIIFVVALIRLSHVFAQTWFILTAFKLELGPATKPTALYGRQCVMFLLVTNISLFFFHVYESMTEGFGYVDPSSSDYTYVKLLAAPLITFYRFHCSVCLVEVWKKTFSRPKKPAHPTPLHVTSSLTSSPISAV